MIFERRLRFIYVQILKIVKIPVQLEKISLSLFILKWKKTGKMDLNNTKIAAPACLPAQDKHLKETTDSRTPCFVGGWVKNIYFY